MVGIVNHITAPALALKSRCVQHSIGRYISGPAGRRPRSSPDLVPSSIAFARHITDPYVPQPHLASSFIHARNIENVGADHIE